MKESSKGILSYLAGILVGIVFMISYESASDINKKLIIIVFIFTIIGITIVYDRYSNDNGDEDDQ